MGHLPVRCKHLVEAPKGANSKRTVELREWDAGVDENAHKVIVIHADVLLGLLAAIVLAPISAFECGPC